MKDILVIIFLISVALYIIYWIANFIKDIIDLFKDNN